MGKAGSPEHVHLARRHLGHGHIVSSVVVVHRSREYRGRSGQRGVVVVAGGCSVEQAGHHLHPANRPAKAGVVGAVFRTFHLLSFNRGPQTIFDMAISGSLELLVRYTHSMCSCAVLMHTWCGIFCHVRVWTEQRTPHKKSGTTSSLRL
jgi:hypothetical protein